MGYKIVRYIDVEGRSSADRDLWATKELQADVKNADSTSLKVDAIPGSLGMYYLLDRENGKALAIALWESEQAMRDSEHRASQIRKESSHAAGTNIVGVEHYEVMSASARMGDLE